jgi:hypothetical protein
MESLGIDRMLDEPSCRHYKIPVIVGVTEPKYSAAELERLKAAEKVKHEYNGGRYTLYELGQLLARLEREFKEQEREVAAYKALGDKAKLAEERTKVEQRAAQSKALAEFIEKLTGGGRDGAAVTVAGEYASKRPPGEFRSGQGGVTHDDGGPVSGSGGKVDGQPKNSTDVSIYRGETLTIESITTFNFFSVEEAMIAFAIVYHTISANERQEYAGRLVDNGNGFSFNFITNSAESARITLDQLNQLGDDDPIRYTFGITRNLGTTIVHTHWNPDTNYYQGFSPEDRDMAGITARGIGREWTEYVVRPDGTIALATFNSRGEQIKGSDVDRDDWDHDNQRYWENR